MERKPRPTNGGIYFQLLPGTSSVATLCGSVHTSDMFSSCDAKPIFMTILRKSLPVRTVATVMSKPLIRSKYPAVPLQPTTRSKNHWPRAYSRSLRLFRLVSSDGVTTIRSDLIPEKLSALRAIATPFSASSNWRMTHLFRSFALEIVLSEGL